jgi:hypothetical protein
MKLDTIIIITKGLCLTIIPTFSVIGGGLGQLNMPVIHGMPVGFWQLVCAAVVAGAGGLLAFISQSFGQYIQGRVIPTVPLPTPPDSGNVTTKP